jgi:hypothetical protein
MPWWLDNEEAGKIIAVGSADQFRNFEVQLGAADRDRSGKES